MTPHPAVLLGLGPDARDVREPLEGWVRRLGFRTRFTTDGREAVTWLGQESFAATFVDSDLGGGGGDVLWRCIRPDVARRTVLLARDRRPGLWFQALRSGVATVLPLPPREEMVRAALQAVTGAWADADWNRTHLHT